jgi:hypothetical protein
MGNSSGGTQGKGDQEYYSPSLKRNSFISNETQAIRVSTLLRGIKHTHPKPIFPVSLL